MPCWQSKLGVLNIPGPLSCSAYQQGVDMNLGDYDGRTALHLAAAEGHVRCVKFLLDTCGVKHDPKDRLVMSTKQFTIIITLVQ